MALIIHRREKYSIIFVCTLIFIIALYQFGVSPVLEKRELCKRQLNEKRQILKKVTLLKAGYEKILNSKKNLRNIYSRRDKNFTLFACLGSLATQAGVAGAIDYIKPSSSNADESENTMSMVEIKLKDISMSQLISYLYLVETSQNIMFVRQLVIAIEGKSKGTISAVLHVETVKT